MQTHFLRLALLTIFAAFIGCGTGNVPMGGTVTFSDDGTPLEKGTVAFSNGQHQARGDIGSGGKYTLGFLNANDGLPKGTYDVYITDAVLREERTVPGARAGAKFWTETRLIDPKYEDPKKSGLSITVDGKEKTFDFKVDRPTGADALPQNR